MLNNEMKELTDRIQEKIGKEAAGLIADDIGLLISDTSKVNSDLENRNNEIAKLKEDKEKLITTNGNLLQQISMGEESFAPSFNKREEKEEAPKLSFRDAFDEKGNFKR